MATLGWDEGRWFSLSSCPAFWSLQTESCCMQPACQREPLLPQLLHSLGLGLSANTSGLALLLPDWPFFVAIREMRIKTILRCHLTQVRMPEIIKTQESWWYVEKGKHSVTASGSENRHITYGNQYEGSFKHWKWIYHKCYCTPGRYPIDSTSWQMFAHSCSLLLYSQ